MVLISYQEPIQQVKLSAEVDYFNPEAGLKMSYPYKNVYFSDKLRFSGIEKHPTNCKCIARQDIVAVSVVPEIVSEYRIFLITEMFVHSNLQHDIFRKNFAAVRTAAVFL